MPEHGYGLCDRHRSEKKAQLADRQKQAQKEWRAKNKERLKAWHAKNKERLKAWHAAYYKANKERCAAITKEWIAKNKTHVKTHRAAYCKAHPEYVRSRGASVRIRIAKSYAATLVRDSLRRKFDVLLDTCIPVPEALILAKQAQLRIKRLIWEKRNEQKRTKDENS